MVFAVVVFFTTSVAGRFVFHGANTENDFSTVWAGVTPFFLLCARGEVKLMSG